MNTFTFPWHLEQILPPLTLYRKQFMRGKCILLFSSGSTMFFAINATFFFQVTNPYPKVIMPFKGTSSLKGYHPQKPHKWGLAEWSLNPRQGMCTIGRCMMGRGTMTLAIRIVMGGERYIRQPEFSRLVEEESPLLLQQLFYLPSLTLFEDLACRQTGASGTLHTNLTSLVYLMLPGIPSQRRVLPLPDMYTFFTWQDRKQVNLVTTVHNDETFEKCTRSKKGPTGFIKQQKPLAIECYMKNMRSEDLADQAMWYSMIVHRSVKGWKKIIIGLL